MLEDSQAVWIRVRDNVLFTSGITDVIRYVKTLDSFNSARWKVVQTCMVGRLNEEV